MAGEPSRVLLLPYTWQLICTSLAPTVVTQRSHVIWKRVFLLFTVESIYRQTAPMLSLSHVQGAGQEIDNVSRH